MPTEEPDVENDRLVVVIFQSTRGGLGHFSHQLFRAVQSQLHRALNELRPAKPPEIDIWLDSPGGDAHQAYKLAVLLHEHSSFLRVVVPDYAKSAATLLSLVADEIYMAPAAELGPLDAQIQEEGQTIETHSALDTSAAIDDLFQVALSVAVVTGGQMLATTGLSRAQVLGPSLDFAANLIEPLTCQLDPVKIHARRALLDVASKYAVDLLGRRHSDAMDQQMAYEIANSLVENYPTHGYIIDRREAHSLGLPIKFLEEYSLGEQVLALHGLFESEAHHEPTDQVIVVNAADLAGDAEYNDAESADHEDLDAEAATTPGQANGQAPGSEVGDFDQSADGSGPQPEVGEVATQPDGPSH